jgi:hypothetical protein
MTDPLFERVFRIYIDNKDSEAFSLKFYKDTSKEDINLVVREAINNLKHHLKNQNLQVWQDADCIDIDYENNLVRLKESILLSEYDPSERLVTTDRSHFMTQPDRTPVREDQEFNYVNFVKKFTLRDSPDKFELIHFDKEEPNSGQFGYGTPLGLNNNAFSSLNLTPIQIKKLADSKIQNFDVNKGNSTTNHPTPMAHSDLSITFNPVKNQSFFVDSQSLGSPYLRNNLATTLKQSIQEDGPNSLGDVSQFKKNT